MYFDRENELALIGLGSYPVAVDPLIEQVRSEVARAVLEALDETVP